MKSYTVATSFPPAKGISCTIGMAPLNTARVSRSKSPGLWSSFRAFLKSRHATKLLRTKQPAYL